MFDDKVGKEYRIVLTDEEYVVLRDALSSYVDELSHSSTSLKQKNMATSIDLKYKFAREHSKLNGPPHGKNNV